MNTQAKQNNMETLDERQWQMPDGIDPTEFKNGLVQVATSINENDGLASSFLGNVVRWTEYVMNRNNGYVADAIGDLRDMQTQNRASASTDYRIQQKIEYLQRRQAAVEQCEAAHEAAKDAFEAVTGSPYRSLSKGDKSRHGETASAMMLDNILNKFDEGKLSTNEMTLEAALVNADDGKVEKKAKKSA